MPFPSAAFCVPPACTARGNHRRPSPTVPLQQPPSTYAAAFLLRPDVAVAAAHSLRTCSVANVGGRRAIVHRSATCLDLALLRLDPPARGPVHTQLDQRPVLGAEYHVFPPNPSGRPAKLVLLQVGFELLLAAACRVPLLVLHDPRGVVRPGWSGAPVIHPVSGSAIGVVTQVLDGEIVHAIPARFVALLDAQSDTNTLNASSYLPGISTQPLLLRAARRAAGEPAHPGVRVAHATKGHALRVGDVITRVNGSSVSSAGTVDWHGVAATWQAAVCEARAGTLVEVEVERNGACEAETVAVCDAREAVGALARTSDRLVLTDEAVFSALSFELLQKWGEEWRRDAPQDLVHVAMREREPGVEEVVVVIGFSGEEEVREGLELLRVVRVDGRPVRRLEDLVESEDDAGEMVLEFANGYVLALTNGRLVDIGGSEVDGD